MAATDYCAQAARRRTAPRARQPYLARRSWGRRSRRALALDSGDRGTHRGGSDTSRCVRTEHLRLGVRDARSARRLWRRPQALHPSFPAALLPRRVLYGNSAPNKGRGGSWFTSLAPTECVGGGRGQTWRASISCILVEGTPGCPFLTKATARGIPVPVRLRVSCYTPLCGRLD